MKQKSTRMVGSEGFGKLHFGKLQFVALLMCLLVISLPFTFAAEVGSVSAVGTIGAGNVVKQGDQVTITANISASPGETLDPTTLAQELSVGSRYVFSSCVPTLLQGQFTCTVAFTLDDSLGTSRVDYSVNLYNDVARTDLQSSKSSSFYIDTVAPTPVISSVNQFGPQVVVSMSSTDTALPGVTTSCSGIAAINLFWRADGVSDQAISFTPQASALGGCSFSNTTSINVASLPSGIRSLCMKADDRAGNTNTVCQSLTLDTSSPAISNITFVTPFGPTSYIGGGIGSGVAVAFNAANANSGSYSVIVDGVNEGPVTCDVYGFCRTQPFLLSAAKTYSVNVSASTAIGIAASSVVPLYLQVDTIAPAFSSLQSDSYSNGVNYFSPGHSLTAHFVENGVGMFSGRAILTLGSTTIGSPNNCTRSFGGGGWDCVWSNVNYVASAQGNLTATLTSVSDDLGNQMTSAASTILTYDDAVPTYDLSTLNVSSVGSPSISGVFFSGSIMKIVFNATDASPLNVVGDFSGFSPINDLSTGTCANGVCTIQSSQFGYNSTTASVSITLSDILGNNVTFQTPSYELLQTSSDRSIGNFTHTLKLIPAGLELTTFPYINQKAYAKIDVHGLGQVIPLSIAFEKCRNIPTITLSANGTVVSNNSVVGDTRLFNSNPVVTVTNSTELLIGFIFKATPVNQPNVQFLCDVDVSGRIGDTYIPKEVETVLVNFTTYNLSVGEIGTNYQRKSDSFVASSAKLGEKLASLDKLFTLLSKLCRLFQVMTSIYNLYNLVSPIPAEAGTPTCSNPITAPLCFALSHLSGQACALGAVADEGLKSQWAKATNGFCKVVNCQLSIKDVYNSKGTGIEGSLAAATTKTPTPPAGQTTTTIPTSDLTNPISMINDGVNPQDTLAGAMYNLCLPAIISNLRKAQQIECQYTLCLKRDVPNGIPPEACDAAYEYSSCVYKTGNLFFWGGFLDQFVNELKSLIADPIATAGSILAVTTCAPDCIPLLHGLAVAAFGQHACETVEAIKNLGAIVGEVSAIKDDWTKKQDQANDYCAEAKSLGYDTFGNTAS